MKFRRNYFFKSSCPRLFFNDRKLQRLLTQDRYRSRVNIFRILSLFFFPITCCIPYCAVDFSVLTQLFTSSFAGNIYICSLLVVLAVSAWTFIRRERRVHSNECIFLRLLPPEADYSLRAHAIRPGIFCGKMKQFIADRRKPRD